VDTLSRIDATSGRDVVEVPDGEGDPTAGHQHVSESSARDALSLNISWLRTFLAVADRRGFGAATSSVYLSQSRVSSHIAALEHALGIRLFARTVRPIALTTAGQVFRAHVEAALGELQEGVEAARTAVDLTARKIVVGSYPSVSSLFLPAVLCLLRNEYPGITVDLIEGNAASLEAALASGGVDVAFRPLQPRIRDASLRNLGNQALWRERVVAVIRTDDPLMDREILTLADLSDRPLIGNPSGTEEEGGGFDLLHAFGECSRTAQVAYLTDQPATLAALVRSAFGIGIIAELALRPISIEGLAVRQIESPTAFRDVAIFWNRRRQNHEAVQAFLAAVQKADPPDEVQRPVERP
jgi:DNA-binding transcriptional LysR family regulator